MTNAMGPPPPRNSSSTVSAPKTSEAPSTSSMPPPPPPKFTNPEPKTSEELRPAKSHSMAPPPPPPKFTSPPPETSEELQPSNPHSMAPPPPPPKFTNPSPETSEEPLESKPEAQSTTVAASESSTVKKQGRRPSDISVPYTIPSWSGAPCHKYSLEVLKDGAIIDQFEVNKKGAYMFGRVDLCDFILEHPTISRFHAVVQFKSTGEAYLYDIGSTHGTFVNKIQVNKKVFVELHVGDVIRFGGSSRLYILQGPIDLMLPESDLKNMRRARIREDLKDMEASLSRAKLEASFADGASWGMQEDAIEEDEEEVDEVTWQNFKGQLTEKQMKTREKVLKRLEKIAHMKKEIDAIRAKDISQGGLTQGQQTQIARNEQRISQLLEELENLEETLNESIRESLGARSGKTMRGKRGAVEDGEDDYMSDDDEFYDRTKKPAKKKSDEPAVETADSLLEKKEEILKEMEQKQKLLLDEDESVQPNEVPEEGDALDAFMSSVSSQLVLDRKGQIQKELTLLQSELDRVLFLLKIADPTGEAAKKRDAKAQEPAPNTETAVSDALKQPPPKKTQNSKPKESVNGADEPKKTPDFSVDEQSIALATTECSAEAEGSEIAADAKDVVQLDHKPQWLGAVHEKKQETKEAPLNMEENDGFVPYKDRKAILENSDLESAAPGLIIRKRKEVSLESDVKASEKSKEAEQKVEDTVALLLKHSKPYHASDEAEIQAEVVPKSKKARKNKKEPKKVLGPEKPSFMSDEPDYDSWVPPEGQSGDGRTSLNDRLGY